MATYYGTNRTLIDAGTAPNSVEPEMNGAVVHWVYDEYAAVALAGTSVVYFGPDLPAEARIVDWIIDLDSLNTASNIKFGTVADDDEFMAYKSGASADKFNYTDDGVAGSLGFEIASGTGQTLCITYSGTSTATGTIRVAVAYTAKGK